MLKIFQTLYDVLLAPKASSEEARRRELILNTLLVGTITLAFVLFMLVFMRSILVGSPYGTVSSLVAFGAVCMFSFFLLLSRLRLRQLAAYLFIGVFVLLATYPTVVWGVQLPQGILTYSLIIVISGVVIGSRPTFWIVGLMIAILATVVHLGDSNIITFDTSWMKDKGEYTDVVAYAITFLIIALVSWLSNREIQHSLGRALESEKALLKERNSLEVKVRERTKLLEKAQMEKMMDLQRFAEFGRLSSTLLHELANPLTSVSLDLEQLEGKSRSKLLGRVREGIAHMEQYVEAARRQLRNQSEIKAFDMAREIERVISLLEPKARSQLVEIRRDLPNDVTLTGDSIRFDHIISNLLTNAIDAYEDGDKKNQIVTIAMVRQGKDVEIMVHDNGRGIAKEQLPHLFEPFYTTKQIVRGTGIGLAITKQAVEESFQGTIEVASSKQAGTLFTVRLSL